MQENAYNARRLGEPRSRRAVWLVIPCGVILGGTIGGFIGWMLGDCGARYEPENVWFLSITLGAAVGFAAATTAALRHAADLTWSVALLIGAGMATVAMGFILLTCWLRKP
jgi:hypothetical protein